MMAQEVSAVTAEDLNEDCRTLLGVASMAVELGAIDRAILIADKVVSASPALREARFASVLFRLIDGQVDEAERGAKAVLEQYPDWTTARILHALSNKTAGGTEWVHELEQIVNSAEEEADVEFARALLAS